MLGNYKIMLLSVEFAFIISLPLGFVCLIINLSVFCKESKS